MLFILSNIFALNSFLLSNTSKPAVSYNKKFNFPKLVFNPLLSLVTPGVSATIAAFLLIS